MGLKGILNGFLFSDPDLRHWFSEITERPQLVLTEFGEFELSQFYGLEKLAYEMWRSMATLRALAKGAPLRVAGTDEWFGDDRSDELDQLLEIYDEREHGGAVSDTGTVFDRSPEHTNPVGIVFLPALNAHHRPWNSFQPLFAHFGLSLEFLPTGDVDFPNFFWGPFNLSDFYEAHKPFGAAFARNYGRDLESVIAVIAGISVSAFRDWQTVPTSPLSVLAAWVLGADQQQKCLSHLAETISLGLAVVPLPIPASAVDVERAFEMLCLSEP